MSSEIYCNVILNFTSWSFLTETEPKCSGKTYRSITQMELMLCALQSLVDSVKQQYISFALDQAVQPNASLAWRTVQSLSFYMWLIKQKRNEVVIISCSTYKFSTSFLNVKLQSGRLGILHHWHKTVCWTCAELLLLKYLQKFLFIPTSWIR